MVNPPQGKDKDTASAGGGDRAKARLSAPAGGARGVATATGQQQVDKLSERARSLARILPLWAEILVGVYLVLVAVFVLDTIIVNWRAASTNAVQLCADAAKAQDAQSAIQVLDKTLGIDCQVGQVPLMKVRLLFWHVTLSREETLLLLVSLAGVIGAQVHALRSYMWYLGNRLFVRSWVAWYLVRPFVGALLGLLVYVVFRAGFLATSPAESLNPYGFVAIAGLVGLFAEQALGKLKDTAETLLSKAPHGENHAPENVGKRGGKPGEGQAEGSEGGGR